MIQIKNRWTSNIIIEVENLWGADLRDANLCGANLCGANLCGANLCDADLCGANLRDANLCGADLCDANLCDADLCGANLRDANLCDAKRGAFTIQRFVLSFSFGCYFSILFDSHIEIGCKLFSFAEIDRMTEDVARGIDGERAAEWWRKYGDIVKAIIATERNGGSDDDDM